MANLVEVKVPDIGDFKDVPVIEVLVKPGDAVKAEDALITLESDKATMDVPSPGAGVVAEIKVKVGDKLSEGSLILMLDAQEGAGVQTVAPAAAAAPAPARRPPPRQWPRPLPALIRAAPTWTARCWCSARVRAVIPPPSGPPISA